MAYRKVDEASLTAVADSIRAKGGTIVLAGDAPSMVDVQASSEAADFFAASASHADYTASSIVASVDAVVSRMAGIVSATGESLPAIYCTVRKDGDRTTYVMMSMSSKESFDDVKVTLPAVGEVSLWDCRTGQVYSVGNTSAESATSLVLDFAPLQEYVYVVTAAPVTSQQVPAARDAEYSKAEDRE